MFPMHLFKSDVRSIKLYYVLGDFLVFSLGNIVNDEVEPDAYVGSTLGFTKLHQIYDSLSLSLLI